MLLSDIHIGHIYLDPMCQHTRTPKSKYAVIAVIDGETIYAFLINSNTPEFIKSSPELAPCDIEIRRDRYPFLIQHPVSHIDFTRLYEFRAKDFSEGYGKLSDDDIAAFVFAVRDCPRLTPKHKRMALETAQKIIKNDGKE